MFLAGPALCRLCAQLRQSVHPWVSVTPVIDLHTHSTFSDGSLTPDALVQESVRAGLTAVALTDHDGVGGVPLFLESCRKAGLRGISGVEISVDIKAGTMHMLGYFVDPENPGFGETLVRIREGREDRNQVILGKLNTMGFSLSWEDVAKFAGEDVVGRPHFAKALIEKGYARNKEAAFDRFLAKGKPAYAERYRLTVEESIAMIVNAGGVPVLAHPFTLGLHKKGLRKLVTELVEKGLQGIEAYYPEHDHEKHRFCLLLAQELDLAVTGGSDFHGSANPGLRLGTGFGGLSVPDDLVDKLYARTHQD